jgi:hypothetical protein
MGVFTGTCMKWCVAGAVSLAVVGCANSKDPQAQARLQEAQARQREAKVEAARRAGDCSSCGMYTATG